MSYEYYIRSNNKILYESNRQLSNDGVKAENTEISIKHYDDLSSQYNYNYCLYISEFEWFYKQKNKQDERLSLQLVTLIKANWKMDSEILIEIKWQGKIRGKPRKINIEVDYRLLNVDLVRDFFALENIDVGNLKVVSP